MEFSLKTIKFIVDLFSRSVNGFASIDLLICAVSVASLIFVIGFAIDKKIHHDLMIMNAFHLEAKIACIFGLMNYCQIYVC